MCLDRQHPRASKTATMWRRSMNWSGPESLRSRARQDLAARGSTGPTSTAISFQFWATGRWRRSRARKGLSRKSIENIGRTVSSVLSQAMEDGLITGNPAFRLGRYYRNGDEMKAEICPLTADEVSALLATARKDFPRDYPLFLSPVST